jgi:hypothetical protein
LNVSDLQAMLRGLAPEEADLHAFCRLLDGHTYSACLCWAILNRAEPGNRKKLFERLRSALADTPSDRRSNRMIGEAVRSVQILDGQAYDLLSKLAVFMSPVPARVLKACWTTDAASAPGTTGSTTTSPARCAPVEGAPVINPQEKAIQLLVSSLLVQKLQHQQDGCCYYTVHPTVRGYVFQQLHHAGDDSLPNLSLPGFTAAAVEVHPGSGQALRMVKDLLAALSTECDRTSNVEDNAEKTAVVQLCRAAFGIVRSRMAANTASRWGSYGEYLAVLMRAANLARKISPELWDFCRI